MDERLSKDELKQLIEEVKGLEGSVLVKLTKSKIEQIKESTWNMPVYDNQTISQREFFRGLISGLSWVVQDVHGFIDQEDKLLQKDEE